MNKAEMYWQTYLNFEKDFLMFCKYIYVTDEKDHSQLNVYSPAIADKFIVVCTEIEALSKEIYYNLTNSRCTIDKDIKFDNVCLSYIDKIYKISEKRVAITSTLVNLTNEKNFIIRPLNKAKEIGDHSCAWKKAYNAVKHDRYNNLYKATMQNFLKALATLYLLNIYYKFQKIELSYREFANFDFSFGSSVFSISKPKNDNVLAVANGEFKDSLLSETESPFIFKLTDDSFARIISLHEEKNLSFNDYLLSQPEMKDQEFLKWLASKGTLQSFDVLKEIRHYRFLKLTSGVHTVEEKLKIIFNTIEFKEVDKAEHFKDKLKAITNENFDSLVYKLALKTAQFVFLNFQNNVFNYVLNNPKCELIIDNGNIKYPSEINEIYNTSKGVNFGALM